MNLLSVFSGISVNDQEVAREFYTNVVELELDDDKMGLSFKLPSGGKLFIYSKEDAHRPAEYTVLNLVVADIDKAVDELIGKGVTFEIYDNLFPGAKQDERGVLHSPDPAQYGPSIARFKDPAGNILSVIEDES
jgi:catechol 2,3-dioxygenase-like lactoylglutathione lyase family enzyme